MLLVVFFFLGNMGLFMFKFDVLNLFLWFDGVIFGGVVKVRRI